MKTVTKAEWFDTAHSIFAAMKDGKSYDIDVKLHRERRTQDANAYMWKLCELLAEKLKITKEEVYRREVETVGVCNIVTLKEEAIPAFKVVWATKGTAWFCKELDDSPLRGYKTVAIYYGSSCYSTKEMSRLIDGIVEECKAQGIETLTPDELTKLKEDWSK